MTPQKEQQLREDFGKFLQKSNAGKSFKAGNMIDAYGSSDFIEVYWLARMKEQEKELVKKIKQFDLLGRIFEYKSQKRFTILDECIDCAKEDLVQSIINPKHE